jgi:hypothetical protein
VTLKDLTAGEQRQVSRAELPGLLQTSLAGLPPAGPGERGERTERGEP